MNGHHPIVPTTLNVTLNSAVDRRQLQQQRQQQPTEAETFNIKSSKSPPSHHHLHHPASYRPASLTVSTNATTIGGGGSGSSEVSLNGAGANGNNGASGSAGVSIIINPMEAAASDDGVDELSSPGTSQMSPPPSYSDIPGTVRPLNRDVPPPSYDDVVDPNGEPPSYDSLFGRILDTHKASRNIVDFLLKLVILLIGTIGCTIACSVTVVIPVIMILVGAVNFNDCPAEPYIPVFLIVGGTFLVFKYLIGVARRFRRSSSTTSSSNNNNAVAGATDASNTNDNAGNECGSASANGSNGSTNRRRRNHGGASLHGSDEEPEEEDNHPAQSIISCFLCGWFITGCVWVYRIYEPIMDSSRSDDPHYCSPIVYIFAFWLITTAYIFFGFVTSCMCCISIYAQTRTEREQ